jgi:hypothetical protein
MVNKTIRDMRNSILPKPLWIDSFSVVLSSVVTPGNYRTLIIVPILPE